VGTFFVPTVGGHGLQRRKWVTFRSNISGPGNADGETSPLSAPTFHLNVAIVVLDNMFDNGQSQSCATLVPASALIHPVKPVEYFWQMRRINA